MNDVGYLPVELIDHLKDAPGFNESSFKAVHQSGERITSIRSNPKKIAGNRLEHLPIQQVIPWTEFGYYLSERPSFTFDPLFHAGAYYVQEASSMFLEQALTQLTDLTKPLTVLDVCAAPGGKSTHLQSLLNNQSVLVSNELIKPRVNILMENITKWGAANCIVTNNEAGDFKKLPAFFDVIVIDAPCSGSGLFRKDPDAVHEWSLSNVEMCSQRQQTIVEEVWPALKAGGLLIYSTCSYSLEEDELIADFISENFDAENKQLDVPSTWGIVETASTKHGNIGYRFYPDQVAGEGFYLTCFKKKNDETHRVNFKPNRYAVDKKITTLAAQWLVMEEDWKLYQHQEQLFAFTTACYDLFLQLQKPLHIRKAGIKVGDIARNEIVPDHALALSTIYSPSIAAIDLTKEQAIAFLRKEIFETNTANKGWMMCMYEGLAIGWIKALGNRINNYYPKEWKIRS